MKTALITALMLTFVAGSAMAATHGECAKTYKQGSKEFVRCVQGR